MLRPFSMYLFAAAVLCTVGLTSCNKRTEPTPSGSMDGQPLASRVDMPESTQTTRADESPAGDKAKKPRKKKRGGDAESNNVRQRKFTNKEQRLKKQLADARRDAEEALRKLPPVEQGPYTNVMLITIDTLRPDHMSCYGAPRQTSPRMDAIAHEGTLFENAFAQRNSTWASLATIMTSLYPVQHGVRHNGLMLKDKFLTVADVMQQHGYVTVAVYSNAVTQNWKGFQFRYPIFEDPVDHRATVAAEKWLDQHGDRKFFMWVHYFAPHADYAPPPQFNKFVDAAYKGPIDGTKRTLTDAMLKRFEPTPQDLAELGDLYDGEILYVDDEVGKLVDKMRGMGIYDKTMVIISSDHGEELYEHDAYIGHDASVYDHALRVPLIVRLPDVVPAGKQDTTQVQHLSIAPTILDVAGISVPQEFAGKSLMPLFKGEKIDYGPSIAEIRDQLLMVRTPQYKYVYNPGNVKLRKLNEGRAQQAGLDGKPDAVSVGTKSDAEQVPEGDMTSADEKMLYMQTKEQELYNIVDDPGEKKDIASGHPEVVEQMKKVIREFQDKYHWKYGDEVEAQVRKDIDSETKEQLENMGYVF